MTSEKQSERLNKKDFIPFMGLRSIKKKMKNLSQVQASMGVLYHTIVSGGIIAATFMTGAYLLSEYGSRIRTERIATQMGFEPAEVRSIQKRHLNSDGIDDLLFELRDGTKLEFISRGYEMKKQE